MAPTPTTATRAIAGLDRMACRPLRWACPGVV
jgi:hypothetical protein